MSDLQVTCVCTILVGGWWRPQVPSGKKREDDNHLIAVREDDFTTVYQQRKIKLATTCI